MAHLSYSEKVKSYMRVFVYLLILTVAELAVVYFHAFPPMITKLLVCVLSLSKAVCVGWWYMHLNHETNGLKLVAILPLFIAFFYATYLVIDAPHRPASAYIGEAPRVFKGHIEAEDHPSEASHEAQHEAAPSTEAAPAPEKKE